MKKASEGQTNHTTLVEYTVSLINDLGLLDKNGNFKKKDKKPSQIYSSIRTVFAIYAPFTDVRPPLEDETTLREFAWRDAECWRLARAYLEWLCINELQIDKKWNLLLYLMLQNSMPDHLHKRGNRETDLRNDCIRCVDHILKTKFNLDLLGSSKSEIPYRAEIIADALEKVAKIELQPESIKKVIQRSKGQN